MTIEVSEYNGKTYYTNTDHIDDSPFTELDYTLGCQMAITEMICALGELNDAWGRTIELRDTLHRLGRDDLAGIVNECADLIESAQVRLEDDTYGDVWQLYNDAIRNDGGAE